MLSGGPEYTGLLGQPCRDSGKGAAGPVLSPELHMALRTVGSN